MYFYMKIAIFYSRLFQNSYQNASIINFSKNFFARIMLYSLCMKFQAELVNFQDQLENRVLCKTFSSRQNSEVHPSVTTHEEIKNVFE